MKNTQNNSGCFIGLYLFASITELHVDRRKLLEAVVCLMKSNIRKQKRKIIFGIPS